MVVVVKILTQRRTQQGAICKIKVRGQPLEVGVGAWGLGSVRERA